MSTSEIASRDADPALEAECDDARRVLAERCAMEEAADREARRAEDALLDARHDYELARERVERARAVADPGRVVVEKARLHAAFRAASDAASDAEVAEAAARDWLARVNALNAEVDEARASIELGEADLLERVPWLERLTLDADAARVASEHAEDACRVARAALAACEEEARLAAERAQREREEQAERDRLEQERLELERAAEHEALEAAERKRREREEHAVAEVAAAAEVASDDTARPLPGGAETAPPLEAPSAPPGPPPPPPAPPEPPVMPAPVAPAPVASAPVEPALVPPAAIPVPAGTSQTSWPAASAWTPGLLDAGPQPESAQAMPGTADDDLEGLPMIVRALRGDPAARDRIVATLAADDASSSAAWASRLASLLDAITGRAIEDGCLDLPDDDFWGRFNPSEDREIVAALSALGFRYDGFGGFLDGRVPNQRDLALAIGYVGLDPIRLRTRPLETAIEALFEHAVVRGDEWLAAHADDLYLPTMIDALGARAADLADLWNSWDRVRPALLER